MEKKFKFSDNPTVAKAVYGAIIALLCITAVVIGIIAANNRKKSNTPDPNPPITDETPGDTSGENEGSNNEGEKNEKTLVSSTEKCYNNWFLKRQNIKEELEKFEVE